MSNDDKGPTGSVFVLQTGVISMVAAVCVAAAAGESIDTCMKVAANIFNNEQFAERYSKEKKISSQKFAQQMGCTLRHVLLGYLQVSGCPKEALEVNLKFIAGEIMESYPTYGHL
jgi:hypothetical protein